MLLGRSCLRRWSQRRGADGGAGRDGGAGLVVVDEALVEDEVAPGRGKEYRKGP